jgi:hypothetical protein
MEFDIDERELKLHNKNTGIKLTIHVDKARKFEEFHACVQAHNIDDAVSIIEYEEI